MKALILFLAVSLAPATVLMAEQTRFSPEFGRCMDASGGVTMAMLECISAEHEKQDARLNAAYKKLMVTLTEERKNSLREAQRAWMKFRDAYSSFLYDPDGGSIARIDANHWLMESTAIQADQLESNIRDY